MAAKILCSHLIKCNYKCPGTELNRYGHCWPQDFKSCVSTNSTTRAGGSAFFSYTCKNPGGTRTHKPKKNPPPERQEELLSGRPGSNRPPRPWQGRALPNELLPQITFNTKER
jgi:hypothetical protein